MAAFAAQHEPALLIGDIGSNTEAGPRPILGPQFRMSETPRQVRGSAPAYQAHQSEEAM